MEGEISNFIFVWATVLSSLCYCHTMDKIFPQKGILRKLAIIPIACLFFYLPLNLTTIHLGGTTSFFVAWLASFKLLLFAFNKGPLFSSTKKSIPLSRFLPLACLPIKFQHLDQTPPPQEFTKKTKKSALNYVAKIALLALCIRVYSYKESIPQKVMWFFYCLHIYFMLELLLAVVAFLARGLIGIELEPQFDEPYLATSLQDFWGRRWNLMVSNILRPTIYEPVRSICTSFFGKKRWISLVAVVATFLVSGIMHELVFYNIGRLKPTGEVMCFFLLHGVCLAVEIVAKREFKGKIWIPGIISGPLTLAFVIYTSFWLFFPPFLRGGADWKACTESLAFIEFVKHQRLISPNNLTCPLL
ncbi:hypothetical protein ACH5RR_017532 [Cinchona calisaya]|uniref:Wax synthase domain-containing protein n=1 Tax=Cinchona calisaya TaxID=153742 RepID=A0ABD2ZK62_9GENT